MSTNTLSSIFSSSYMPDSSNAAATSRMTPNSPSSPSTSTSTSKRSGPSQLSHDHNRQQDLCANLQDELVNRQMTRPKNIS